MLAKSAFLANFDVSMPAAPFKSEFAMQFGQSNSNFILFSL